MTEPGVKVPTGLGEGTGAIERLPRHRITMTARQLRLVKEAITEIVAYSDAEEASEMDAIRTALESIEKYNLSDADISYAPEVMAPGVETK